MAPTLRTVHCVQYSILYTRICTVYSTVLGASDHQYLERLIRFAKRFKSLRTAIKCCV